MRDRQSWFGLLLIVCRKSSVSPNRRTGPKWSSAGQNLHRGAGCGVSDLLDLERVYVGQVSGEDAVDELIGEVSEDEASLRLFGVLQGLHEAQDASVQRVDREPDHTETTVTVAPRQVRQLLQRRTPVTYEVTCTYRVLISVT